MWIYDVQVNDIENDNVSVASNMALMKIKNYTDNRSITTDKKVIPYSIAQRWWWQRLVMAIISH